MVENFREKTYFCLGKLKIIFFSFASITQDIVLVKDRVGEMNKKSTPNKTQNTFYIVYFRDSELTSGNPGHLEQ